MIQFGKKDYLHIKFIFSIASVFNSYSLTDSAQRDLGFFSVHANLKS